MRPKSDRLLAIVPAVAEIPPRPADGEFLHDLAGIVPPAKAQEVRDLQRDIFRNAGVPIIVVTVNSMGEYDPGAPSMESFARRWFDTWGIGSRSRNNGILVLVSRADRKARIEMGADWGGRFDEFCRRLMSQKLVPAFRAGNYGKGLMTATASLGEIAKAGPKAEPPGPGLTERILDSPIVAFSQRYNPVAKYTGATGVLLLALAGVGCLLAAWLVPQHRKALLISGAALIAIGLVFWVVLIALGLLLRSKSGSSWNNEGSRSGDYDGGSSGGGGATGSW